MSIKQPSLAGRAAYNDVINDLPALVPIPGTRRAVQVRGIKPYTLERLTRLWLSRDIRVAEDSSETLRELCRDPYFSIKQAALIVLNGYWRIRLLFPLLWRWWAYVRGYTEGQMTPIITEGKKKLPLTPYWMNMAFTADMRADWMKMTAKEAEQFRRELLTERNAPSSRTTQPMGAASTPSSSGGSATGDTVVF